MPDSRKAVILARALDYLLDHGVADLSLRPLAKASGTSARLLIYHFGSRDGLITEVMDEVRARMQGAFSAVAARPDGKRGSPLEGFWEYATQPEARKYVRLLFEVQVLAMHRPKEFSKYLDRASGSWLSLAQGALKAHKQDPALATLSVAVVDGLMLELLSTGDKRRTTAALALFQQLLEGSKTRRAR